LSLEDDSLEIEEEEENEEENPFSGSSETPEDDESLIEDTIEVS
jgi:hypothetical protein